MARLLSRYLDGEREAVWRDLGTNEVADGLREEVQAVATETMRRVRHNVDVLIERLTAEGFRFANPQAPTTQDAQGRYACVRAVPAMGTDELIQEVERLAGALPFSVKAFYREVGPVNLQGALDESLTTADAYSTDADHAFHGKAIACSA